MITISRDHPSLRAVTTVLLLFLAAACGSNTTGSTLGGSGGSGGNGGEGASASTPTIVATQPIDGATSVPVNGGVSAAFSEAMDPATLGAGTFGLTSGSPPVSVAGTVIYADSKATFWPAAQLATNTTFTATVTADASSANGIPMAAARVWSFTTGDSKGPILPVSLGSAGEYVLLAKSGISTVPIAAITGNLGISPAAASFITGFSLTADPSNVFATSAQVIGRIYAADYAPPSPSNLTTAIGDMELAFTDAAGRAPDVTELGAGNIGGMTLVAGVYKWGTGVLIPTDVTLSGSATDVWIFQIGQDLTSSSATNVILSGGALPKNVFWQVAGFVDLGTTSHLEGIVLTQTAITLRTGASIDGRLLAQTAIELDESVVVEPAP